MIAFAVKNLGERRLDGTPVEVRDRLTGYPGGCQWWITDWRVVRPPQGWRFWRTYGPWERASNYECRLLGLPCNWPRG